MEANTLSSIFIYGFGRDSSPEPLPFDTEPSGSVPRGEIVSCPEPCTPRWRLKVHLPGLFMTFQHCQEHLPQHSVEGQDLYMEFLFSPPPVISFQMRGAEGLQE